MTIIMENLPQPQRKDGSTPCGECHLKAGETCDICGAKQLSDRAEAAAQMMADRAWPGALKNDDTCAALMIGCGIAISHVAGEWDKVVSRARELSRSPLAKKVDAAIAAGHSPWDKT